MERRLRNWAGCGLLIVLATTGCRSMHSNVPPGPKFSPDGRAQPSVGFSSDPHMPNQIGNPALNPATNIGPGGIAGASGTPTLGTPGPNSSNFGVPGGAAFGSPGTSGASPSVNPNLGSGSPSASGGAAGQPVPFPGSN